jgi:calcineurin-like phosphoesterase family protein
MNTFFSSDYHFFHANIIKYCNRPFKDLEQMHETIIRNHNQRVKPEDSMYFLGDFGFSASSNRAFRGEGQPYSVDDILSQMNGKNWNFVSGNHDKSSNKLKTKNSQITLRQGDLNIQVLHDPTYAKVDYDIVLCGHVHEKFKVKELHYCGKSTIIINTGVDVWNFKPVKLDEILSIYYRWKLEKSKINRWETSKIIEEENKSYG